MRIRSPDEVGVALATRLLAPAQARGLPIPACLLAIEVLRLLAALGLGLAALAAAGGAQGVLLGLGALLMTRSALALIPIYRSEWRDWDAEWRTYYRERAGRLRASGAAGRLAKLVLALALGIAVPAAFLPGVAAGLPGVAGALGAGVAALVWVDLLSVYAACVAPRP